ncbi:MAG: GNAT family N-acetyltransferase [Bacteroidota bacterium]|nr:GNAT family N-acetyltransferase [Bacteroidota bacterium]
MVLYEFLEACDGSFAPPLSTKVCISDYADKLSELATHFTISNNKETIGICCCYCNQPEQEIAYISVTCILPQWQGKGMGKLLTEYVEREVKKIGFQKIRLEIHKHNYLSLKMHNDFGYVIIKSIDNSHYLQKDL